MGNHTLDSSENLRIQNLRIWCLPLFSYRAQVSPQSNSNTEVLPQAQMHTWWGATPQVNVLLPYPSGESDLIYTSENLRIQNFRILCLSLFSHRAQRSRHGPAHIIKESRPRPSSRAWTWMLRSILSSLIHLGNRTLYISENLRT